MLDNVIDNNYYPTPESKTANLRHGAGLGMMGYQDAYINLIYPLIQMKIWASQISPWK